MQALAGQDIQRLQAWLTDIVITGAWRADSSDSTPADAVKELAGQLGPNSRPALVAGADLKALLGCQDLLAIPRPEAGVIDTFLVSGCGPEGKDEAVLVISRLPDNQLKLHGWMVIKGGMSGARLGGAVSYQNDQLGVCFFVPTGYQIYEPDGSHISVFSPPPAAGGHPGGAYLDVSPAGGRDVDQVVEDVKAELGPGFNVAIDTAMGIDDAKAQVVSGLPGQDVNLQLYMVHNDLVFHILFAPANEQAGEAHTQMQDLYAMITNTFHLTR